MAQSFEELYMLSYLDELVQYGYVIEYIYQPEPFLLSDAAKYQTESELRTKFKIVEKELIRKHIYTADFIIVWNKEKSEGLFTKDLNSVINNNNPYFFAQTSKKSGRYISIIDTKGSFVGKFNSSGVTFPINQKWVLSKYELFVQKIIPFSPDEKKNKITIPSTSKCLFAQTFTPRDYRYRKMVNGKGFYKIPYSDIRTIQEFID